MGLYLNNKTINTTINLKCRQSGRTWRDNDRHNACLFLITDLLMDKI